MSKTSELSAKLATIHRNLTREHERLTKLPTLRWSWPIDEAVKSLGDVIEHVEQAKLYIDEHGAGA